MLNYSLRLILIGDCAVGKTAFATKLRFGSFDRNYDATIGVDYSARTLCIDTTAMIKCQLWDTAGQENFAPLIKTYYKDVGGAILLFDVNNRDSFRRLDFWVNELRKNGPQDWEIPKILVGNKIDLDKRAISKEEADEYAKSRGFKYIETSVKDDINVEETLVMIAEDAYKNKEDNKGLKLYEHQLYDLKLKQANPKPYRENCCCIC